jgi:hypothetical protein
MRSPTAPQNEENKEKETFYLDEASQKVKVEDLEEKQEEEKVVEFNIGTKTPKQRAEQTNNKLNKFMWPLNALNNKLFTSSTTSALFKTQQPYKPRANSMTVNSSDGSSSSSSHSNELKYTTGAYYVQVKLWLAQILCALSRLHDMGILCKDLNPENLLLSASGDCVLSFFSYWNLVDQSLSKTAAENFYVAPGEI